jgi:hypothetical protein
MLSFRSTGARPERGGIRYWCGCSRDRDRRVRPALSTFRVESAGMTAMLPTPMFVPALAPRPNPDVTQYADPQRPAAFGRLRFRLSWRIRSSSHYRLRRANADGHRALGRRHGIGSILAIRRRELPLVPKPVLQPRRFLYLLAAVASAWLGRASSSFSRATTRSRSRLDRRVTFSCWRTSLAVCAASGRGSGSPRGPQSACPTAE